MRLIVRLVVNFLAVLASLYVVNVLFRGSFELGRSDLVSVLVFSVILMVLNAFLKPILELLALPLSCLTFGLFSFVVSGIIYAIAAYFVPGIDLPEPKILAAIVGAIVVSVIAGILGAVTNDKK